MSKFDIAYKEIINSKSVVVKSDRICRKCKKKIIKGSKAVTASHLFDKKYNISFKEIVDKKLDTRKYKFVTVRHWFCNECFQSIKKMSINKNSLNLTKNEVEDIIYSEKFNELSEDVQLEQIQAFYAKGLLTTREFDQLERDLIHVIALRDAYFNEF